MSKFKKFAYLIPSFALVNIGAELTSDGSSKSGYECPNCKTYHLISHTAVKEGAVIITKCVHPEDRTAIIIKPLKDGEKPREVTNKEFSALNDLSFKDSRDGAYTKEFLGAEKVTDLIKKAVPGEFTLKDMTVKQTANLLRLSRSRVLQRLEDIMGGTDGKVKKITPEVFLLIKNHKPVKQAKLKTEGW